MAASIAMLRLRARLLAWLRAFMAERGILELQTPLLSAAANSDPALESFETRYSGPVGGGPAPRWLRTSPEFALKRLLCRGVGDCYELGPVFRNGEFGREHNPEFTMLEWYRVGWDHLALAEEVAALVEGAFALVGRALRRRRLGYVELFAQHLGIDPLQLEDGELRARADALAGHTLDLDRDGLLDLLLSLAILPQLAEDELLVLVDFPASQAALARIHPSDPRLACRFEVYVGARELANGYHELADPAEQRLRFERDLRRRQRLGLPCHPLDEHFLAALADPGLPDCAGVALGVDRLLQAMTEASSIAEVLAWSFERA